MGNVPDRIGEYEVLREIGRGGMGVVYLARDPRLAREVAIKCLPDDLATDEQRLARFRREARLLASLNHANIATVYSLEEVDGRAYLVLEYVDGDALFPHLDRAGRSWQRCVEIGAQIADALAAAHDEGVVHRDIKPDNVMFTRHGTTKVLDFGLAVLARPDGDPDAEDGMTRELLLTAQGAILGTPGYMAPEQARGRSPDARADIFAFGCLLHEMLSGTPVFVRDTAMDSIAATLNDPPSGLEDVAAPQPLRELVARCLAKAPEDRPATARSVAAALRALLQDPPSTDVVRAEMAPRSTWWRIPLAVVLVGLLPLGLWLQRRGPGAEPIARSVAVLRFENLTKNPELDYVARQLPTTLIGDLSTLAGLRVLPRSTTFRYDVDDDPVAIGQSLDVDYVLDGDVERRAGLTIVRADLIDVAEQRSAWSRSYERTGAEPVELVEEIVDHFTRALGLVLSEAERIRLARRRPASRGALRAYWRGRAAWDERTASAYARAIDLFGQAIRRDPTFALAHAGIADAHSLLALNLARPASETMPVALQAAGQAVRYGPELPETHTSLGLIAWLWEWDYAKAESHFRRAIEIQERHATAHHFLAHVLATRGDTAGAVEHSRKAVAYDPHAPSFGNCLGHHLVWDGRRAAGLRRLRETFAANPRFPLARTYLGRTLVAKGTPAEQEEGIELLEGFAARNPYADGELGWALAVTGRRDGAKRELATLEDLAESGTYVANVAFAKVHAGLGDEVRALAYLRKAVEEREAWLPLSTHEPHFVSLQGNPELWKILEPVHLKP